MLKSLDLSQTLRKSTERLAFMLDGQVSSGFRCGERRISRGEKFARRRTLSRNDAIKWGAQAPRVRCYGPLAEHIRLSLLAESFGESEDGKPAGGGARRNTRGGVCSPTESFRLLLKRSNVKTGRGKPLLIADLR